MLLPEVFDLHDAGFVLLLDGQKYPPLEADWQAKPHPFEEAVQHVARGGNVGVLAGCGGLAILDQDDPAAFGLTPPSTTTWQTRPGRRAMLLRMDGDVAEALQGIGKKPDLAQIKLFKDGRHVGELKLQRSYQLIPPSWKTLEDGTRVSYQLIDSRPPCRGLPGVADRGPPGGGHRILIPVGAEYPEAGGSGRQGPKGQGGD